jgi:hypothetical protein
MVDHFRETAAAGGNDNAMGSTLNFSSGDFK